MSAANSPFGNFSASVRKFVSMFTIWCSRSKIRCFKFSISTWRCRLVWSKQFLQLRPHSYHKTNWKKICIDKFINAFRRSVMFFSINICFTLTQSMFLKCTAKSHLASQRPYKKPEVRKEPQPLLTFITACSLTKYTKYKKN